MKKEKSNKRKEGQRRYDCLMARCEAKGRLLGRLGDLPFTYCPRHRKKGERILNFLVNSLMRYKLTKFLQDAKQQLFMDNLPRLSNESYTALNEFVNNMIIKLDEMEKTLPLDEIDLAASEDFDDE